VIKQVADHYEGFLPQYGLYFTHDFNFKDVSLEGLEAALAAQVGEVSEKYARRADRMKRVLGSGKRILFVLCGPLTLTEINAFNSVVESHYPQLHYMIVHVPFSNYGDAKVEHPKVHSHPIVTEYYPGNDQGWDEALEGIDIQPVPRNIEEFLTGEAILTYA
jgi:hypothetical protein